MCRVVLLSVLYSVGLAGGVTGQTIRVWSSNADQRWNQNGNWTAANRPDAATEIAQFGTGTQLNPQLNANNYTVRGIRFSAGAASHDVGDNNGARTLRIGNGTSGFIANLSANDQLVSIATLQFQSNSTLRTAGTGGLAISSNLTGNNRDLTFDTVGDISVSGNITTGSGTLTKQGSGNLNLSGANTYTGLTTITAGAIGLESANVFADAADVSISSGATLRLNDLTDTISQVSGSGAIDFGLAGTGRLTLGSGASTFAGSFIGSGELVIGAGATLTLGADFSNANLNITLAGGTLQLAGHSLTVGAFNLSANSSIDFDAGANSTLAVETLGFDDAGLSLTAANWADAADYFYSQTGYLQGSAPLNQVVFQGWSTADTKWQSYDNQITPVPEPATYGAWLLAVVMAAGWRIRRRSKNG